MTQKPRRGGGGGGGANAFKASPLRGFRTVLWCFPGAESPGLFAGVPPGLETRNFKTDASGCD